MKLGCVWCVTMGQFAKHNIGPSLLSASPSVTLRYCVIINGDND